MDPEAGAGHPSRCRTAARPGDHPPLRGRRGRRHRAARRTTGSPGCGGRPSGRRTRRPRPPSPWSSRPPSALKPQPIPPSADWRIDLARGCPAHCQYCYLAGSLTGPPITRVYANLDEVLAGIGTHAGRGHGDQRHRRARRTRARPSRLSCYTDPLGIEHVTGSVAEAVRRVGAGPTGTACSCASPPSSTTSTSC